MSIAALLLILLVASVVAIISRRVRLPYSVGLVAAGLVLARLPVGLTMPLTRELIFNVFLPPLVFEAALQLEWRRFRRELPVTLTLAFPGVALATAMVAVGLHVLLGWSWQGAGLFGVLIAATDPVSVIAAFRALRVAPRLSMLVESESLLNDGAAAVGFAVLAGGGDGGWVHMLATLLWAGLGGVAAGAAAAGAVLLLARRTDDHLVEITLTTIAAYGSFLLAEHFAMSGVLASLTAGLMIGNLAWRDAISEGGQSHALDFWEYATFLANSFVFIMIGTQGAHTPRSAWSWATAAALALVLLGRGAAVYALCALFARTRLRVGWGSQHILVWGGLRGALALALALAVPEGVAERQEIGVTAFAVVAFSIFVQGLTMPLLIRRCGASA
jgi:CPA1 family monovalent cation:H+ antiporter